MRKFNGLSETTPVIWQFENDTPLKSHPCYQQAKKGDFYAANDLAEALVSPEILKQACLSFIDESVLLPVIAEELQGDNAIPLALAGRYAEALAMPVGAKIFQQSKAYHTGADPMERMISRVYFSGFVEPHHYILVDDVSTMGSTLADLASYLVEQGGKIAGVILLSNCSRSKKLLQTLRQKSLIAQKGEKFYEQIQQLFRVEPDALTFDEAQYLIGFRTVDELRARAVKAQNTRESRIASKTKT